jgi:RNA-binding protein
LLDVGTVLHVARSGRLIVRLSKKVEPGWILTDSKGRNVARVTELIGPTKHPYASALLTAGDIGPLKGETLFLTRLLK